MHESRIAIGDTLSMFAMFVLPVLIALLIHPLIEAAISGPRVPRSVASVQVVAGMSAMFGFFGVTLVGFGIFREHNWMTWDRLRVSVDQGPLLLVAKVAVPLALIIAQTVILFGLGGLVFGIDLAKGDGTIVLVALVTGACFVSIGLALAALCGTIVQFNMFGNLGFVLFGFLGGALIPLQYLPAAAQWISPLVPTYWTMKAYKGIAAGSLGTAGLATCVLVLVAWTLGSCVLAVWRMRFEERKFGWA